MKYIAKTTKENGVEKLITTRSPRDRRKKFYLLIDENGENKFVDKQWLINGLSDVVNLGLSGSNFYIKQISKSPLTTYCNIFWRYWNDYDEKYMNKVCSYCHLFEGSIQDLITALNTIYRTVTYEKKKFFGEEGYILQPKGCMLKGIPPLYVTQYKFPSDKTIYSCYAEVRTGYIGKNSNGHMVHSMFTDLGSAKKWLDNRVENGKKIVESFVAKNKPGVGMTIFENFGYNSVWFYPEELGERNYKEIGIKCDDKDSCAGYIRVSYVEFKEFENIIKSKEGLEEAVYWKNFVW